MSKKSFIKKIFSVENEKLHKVTTILGIKFKTKNKYKELLNKLDIQDKIITDCEKNITHKLEKMFNEKIKKVETSNEQLKKELSIIKKYTQKPDQNIQKHLFNLAGMETAKYIIDKMPTVSHFANKYELLTFALSKVSLDGLFLEFGVYSGNTINHISKEKPYCKIYGFDSFEGLPESWRSGFEKGKFTKENLPEVNSNVTLIKGWFDQTLPSFVNEHSEQIAFLHVDCDLYSSTKTVFNTLNNRIKSGTVIVFDEYFNYPNWQNHEYKAFQEFIKDSGLEYEYIGYVYTLEQVAVIIK